MDNLLEILVPLIFAAIYFFGNMLGKSKDEEDTSPLQRRREADEDTDLAERQRRIQEEIRRKIMERRQSGSGGRPQVSPAAQESREVRKETPEVVHESRPPPIIVQEAREEAKPPAFTWDESGEAYESEMQAKLRQIEATKRQAEELKRKAAQKGVSLEAIKKGRRRSKGYFTGTVRDSLQDPQAARVAFIYGEVLGQPVSMRKTPSVPGLS